jgi:hypothetical protein
MASVSPKQWASAIEIQKGKNMTTRTVTLIHTSSMNILRLALLSSLVMAAPLLARGQSNHDHASPPRLVQLVRAATEKYIDVNDATADGYGPFLGCISGSDHGAMGVHYVKGALLNGEIDVAHPQALIYEPSNGAMRLVGVEFIADQATWLKNHASPPVLEGQTFLLVDFPNRYGINAFFELHVWAWRDNPQGAFVDWNNHVSCEGQ